MPDKAIAATSYGGGAVAVVSALTLTDLGIVVGIVTALMTFALNVAYHIRKDRREREEHEIRIAMIKRNPERRSGIRPPDGCADNPPSDCPYENLQ
jgi:hypothetical protein